MFRVHCLILLIFASTQAISQNRLESGLRTGKWTETGIYDATPYIRSGNYKVVPITQYNKIRELGEHFWEIRFKGSTPLLYYSSLNAHKISVRDSIWNSFDTAGNLRNISFWQDGLEQWRQHFDVNGMLFLYEYEDFDNDSSFELTYVDSQLFKRAFYAPENKNRQTKIYYPENDLIISDAELTFYINYLNAPAEVKEIKLASKKGCIIRSIRTGSEFTKVYSSKNKELVFPIVLAANLPLTVKVAVRPNAKTDRPRDTLYLSTDEFPIPYRIYLDTKANHVDNRNVETLKNFKLSKSKDQYLVISRLGTETDATIISKTGQQWHYNVEDGIRIDLSNFSTGLYRLEITSCNTAGIMELQIVE